jgi:hypothetical protein
MPRFYFYTRQDGRLLTDDQGLDLPDAEVAKQEAIRAAREIAASYIKGGLELPEEAIVVVDEHGHPVMTLPLGEVLSPYVGRK